MAGSATWWGLPGLAAIFVGVEELATGNFGWGVITLILGGFLLAVARSRYRATGRL